MAALGTFPSLMPRDDRRGQEQVPSVFRCWRRRQRSVSRVGPATLPAATYGQQKISSLWPDNTCSLASNAGRSLASSARGSVFLYSSASSRARAYRGSVVMCHNVRVHVCLWCSFVIAPHHHAHAVWHAIYTTHGDDCYKEELLVSLLDMPVRPSKFSEIFCYYHQTSRCISASYNPLFLWVSCSSCSFGHFTLRYFQFSFMFWIQLHFEKVICLSFYKALLLVPFLHNYEEAKLMTTVITVITM